MTKVWAALVAAWAVNLWAATVAERPMPGTNAVSVGARPVLQWSLPGENLLGNGGFEGGTNGWNLPANARAVNIGLPALAVEGTNYLRVTEGEVWREVVLPATNAPMVWSFAVWNGPARMAAEVRSVEGAVLKRNSFWMQGSGSKWQVCSTDVSEFAGERVSLVVVVYGGSSVSQWLDDFRVTVFPAGVEFAVYVGAVGPDLLLQGRTRESFWEVTNLRANWFYQWRVDTIEGGVTNVGAVWSFKTAPVSAVAGLSFSEIPEVVCPGTGVAVKVGFVDQYGFESYQAPSPKPMIIMAGAENGRAAGVVVTEVNVAGSSAVEFMNVSTNTVDLSGWRAQFFIGQSATPKQQVLLPTNAVLGPGEIFTVAEVAAGSWPHLRVLDIGWTDSDTNVEWPRNAGVALRDADSNVVDCVFIDRTPRSSTYYSAQRMAVSVIDWRGAMVTNSTIGKTYQRVGDRDTNLRSDWTVAAGSMGTANVGLRIPFAQGYGLLAVEIVSRTNNVMGGGVGMTLRFPGPSTNVWLMAQTTALYSGGYLEAGYLYGESQVFQVAAPGHCLTLAGPEQVGEDSGKFPLRVILSAPALADVAVTLGSSDAFRVAAPGAVVLAGQSEALAQISVLNNARLEGSQVVKLGARAASYSVAETSVRVADDEKATLRVFAPAVVREGVLEEMRIESSVAPDVPIRLWVDHDKPDFYSYVVTLPAGATNVTTILGSESYYLHDNGPVRATVSFENWEPASAQFEYIDTTPRTISLGLPTQLVEGEVKEGNLSLYGPTPAPVEIELTSSRPEIVSVPAKVTMPENFYGYPIVNVATVRNGLPDGLHTVQITAKATGFETVTHTITVFTEGRESGEIQAVERDENEGVRVQTSMRKGWTYSLIMADAPEGPWRSNWEITAEQDQDGAVLMGYLPANSASRRIFFRIWRRAPSSIFAAP